MGAYSTEVVGTTATLPTWHMCYKKKSRDHVNSLFMYVRGSSKHRHISHNQKQKGKIL